MKRNYLLFIAVLFMYSVNVCGQTNRIWATYYGGSATDGAGTNMCVTTDVSGNVYIVGSTISISGIASGGFQNTFGGVQDAFLAKFNSNGNLLWATYYGGADIEYGLGIDVDPSGNIYLAGLTSSSTGIATVGSYQPVIGGGGDGFLVKFDSSGNRLWATYYGGPGADRAGELSIDNSGNIYFTGYSYSTTGIASGGFQNTLGGGNDAILVKFDQNGNRLWATYYGGTESESGHGIAIDASGNVYLCGNTFSSNAIAAGGFQNTFGGGSTDGFLVKFNSSGVRQWATYYGSSGDEFAWNVKVDISGNILLAGATTSTSGIASGGYQNTYGGGTADGYVVKFNPGGGRIWGTYFGEAGYDNVLVNGLATDGSGNIFLSGATTSLSGIASGGFQNVYGGGSFDAFLVKFDSNCNLLASTYYGGTGTDVADAVTVDLNNKVYLCGRTDSPSGIASGGFQNSFGGGSNDLYLVKFDDCTGTVAQPVTISGPDTVCNGASYTYSIAVVAGATSYTWTLPSGWSGTSTTNSINTTASATSGNITVTANNACGNSSPQTLAITVNTIPSTPGPISGTSTICSGSSNIYSITTVSGATSYTWTLPGGWSGTSTTNSINTTASATAGNITVTANNACGSSSPQTLAITVNTVPASPDTISGLTNICSGSANTYSITSVPGATSYTWTLPSGWSGTSTTSSINTTASATAGNITVTANNACGNSSPQTLAITVNTVPASPGTISGLTSICSVSANTYSISSVPGATSYTWTLPGGWSGTSTNNSINTTASATGGNITVTANNACGSSTPQTLAITVNTAPSTPGIISGSTTICAGSIHTYSITAIPGATSYTWTLPSGWSGTSTTNSINTTASATSGNITVTANNDCGNSSSQTLTITVNPLPMVSFNSSNKDTLCINAGLQTLSGGTPAGGTYSGAGVVGTNFDPNAAGLGTHTITYSFTDGNSCTNTATINITVIGCSGIEANSSSSILIYPNPFTNSITLNGIEGAMEVKLYNTWGEVLRNWIITEANNALMLENLQPGIYFIHIQTENGSIIRKIIKDKH